MKGRMVKANGSTAVVLRQILERNLVLCSLVVARTEALESYTRRLDEVDVTCGTLNRLKSDDAKGHKAPLYIQNSKVDGRYRTTSLSC